MNFDTTVKLRTYLTRRVNIKGVDSDKQPSIRIITIIWIVVDYSPQINAAIIEKATKRSAESKLSSPLATGK